MSLPFRLRKFQDTGKTSTHTCTYIVVYFATISSTPLGLVTSCGSGEIETSKKWSPTKQWRILRSTLLESLGCQSPCCRRAALLHEFDSTSRPWDPSGVIFPKLPLRPLLRTKYSMKSEGQSPGRYPPFSRLVMVLSLIPFLPHLTHGAWHTPRSQYLHPPPNSPRLVQVLLPPTAPKYGYYPSTPSSFLKTCTTYFADFDNITSFRSTIFPLRPPDKPWPRSSEETGQWSVVSQN